MHINYLSLIKTIALCRKNKQRVKKKDASFHNDTPSNVENVSMVKAIYTGGSRWI